MQAVVPVEGNAVGVFGCGIGKGALHLFCDFGAFDNNAHFGVETRGTGVEVERTDEDAFAVHNEGFGVQAGYGAAGQAFVFCGGDGMVGLQLVEFDAGFEQRFSVFDIAGMDGGNVGRL